jgi:helicase
MAIRATFIGINKHLDPDIRELTGARRDAIALSALFIDSIPDLSAELLVDGEATLERIDAALRRSMDHAEEDDVVVVTFSEHGTHDHRLVTYNSVVDQLTDSTLSMDALAHEQSEGDYLRPRLLLQRWSAGPRARGQCDPSKPHGAVRRHCR